MPAISGCFQPGAAVFSVLYAGWILPISDALVSSSFDHLHALISEVSFLLRPPTRVSWHGGAFPSELGFFFSFGLPRLLLLNHIYKYFFFSSVVLHSILLSSPVGRDAPSGPAAPSAVLAGHERAQLVSLSCSWGSRTEH